MRAFDAWKAGDGFCEEGVMVEREELDTAVYYNTLAR